MAAGIGLAAQAPGWSHQIRSTDRVSVCRGAWGRSYGKKRAEDETMRNNEERLQIPGRWPLRIVP